jgi:hypothetical protein
VTLAATGQVRVTLSVYADFGALQPGAFSKMDDALTALSRQSPAVRGADVRARGQERHSARRNNVRSPSPLDASPPRSKAPPDPAARSSVASARSDRILAGGARLLTQRPVRGTARARRYATPAPGRFAELSSVVAQRAERTALRRSRHDDRLATRFVRRSAPRALNKTAA